MIRGLIAAVVGALVLAGSAAASPSASAPRVVVARQHGVLLVASARGMVQAVAGKAAIGARVLVRGNTVVRTVGRARTALIRGVVVRRGGGLTFLSAAGHLLLVHGAGRRLASAGDTSPAPGTVVQQTVGIDAQGNLDDQGEEALGQSGQVQITAQITAIGTGTVTLTVNGQQLTLPLPAGLTLPSSLVGTQVSLSVSFAGGQATATEQGDDEQGDEQGGSQGSPSGSGQTGGQGDSGGEQGSQNGGGDDSGD